MIGATRRAVLLVPLGASLAGLAACAHQTRAVRAGAPSGLARAHELSATPFFAQTAYHCGPAALATALAAVGIPADPVRIAEQVFLPARQGTLQTEMIAGARRQGAVATRIAPTLEAALREVHAGNVVVVLLNLGLKWLPAWHYAVLVGYDLDAGEVLLRSGATFRAAMAMRTFEHTWARSGSWAFAALPPGRWPVSAPSASVIEAALGFERVAAPARAVDTYRSAIERAGPQLTLQMGLGNSLHAAGDSVAAVAVFRNTAMAHRSAAAWINLALLLRASGDTAGARHAAREAGLLGDAAWAEPAQALQDELADTNASRPAGALMPAR